MDKYTEAAFSSTLNNIEEQGSYLCRNCGRVLFRSSAKFKSSCGWPSFDCEIDEAIKYIPDADGRRTEILCNNCDAHLGHVFHNEGFTHLNTRHCVNGLAIDFVHSNTITQSSEIILAAGCFWGVEYYIDKMNGVVLTEVGYSGGNLDNPAYKDVCSGTTKHLEVVRVIFDSDVTTLAKVLQYFFEIHDFTQTNGQGPDIGEQYLSAVFYYDQQQQLQAKAIIQELQAMSYSVATQVLPMQVFWMGEEYHQDYYTKNTKTPYCHQHNKIFK